MQLDILRSLAGQNDYVSGEKISADLGITRAAVWKQIKALRGKGFVIKAIPSRGYKILRYPDLSPDYILSRVYGDFWKDLFFYKSVDSTNEAAARLEVSGRVVSGTVIIADMQEKGRGRLGRQWISPPGSNIYMSIVLKPEIQPKDAPLLTMLTAVTCAQAITNVSKLNVSIKWPNDLLVAGKKIGG
ncbi:MAG: biotin--[acetyl-CoA-carboxylase] ligase, partial [Nitrospirae bacterium]|nr:biotin--[acetyl-CoA-carboxylase] ligase [Nitrospirota bacterium]